MSWRERCAPAIVAAFLCWPLGCASAFAADTAEPPPGLLAPVTVEARVLVPKDGLWRAPQGSFVCLETVHVQAESGRHLERCEGEPRQGQFECRADGAIAFAGAEAGRRVVVRYQFQPRRVALLGAATATDYADAAPLLEGALAEELSRRGFVVVPAAEVISAAAAGLDAISPEAPPEKLTALARRTNAAYVLVLEIAVRQGSRPGDVDLGIPYPEEKLDRPPKSFFEEEQTLVLPTTRYRLYGGVRLTVVDGATGTVLAREVKGDSQRVRFRRFSPARRSLVRSLAAQVVAAWRDPAR